MLKVTNLCKDFGTFKLDNVSFHIPQGVIVGFVGQNGAGKTTTLKCIMRAITPDSGSVVAFGKDMLTHEHQIKSQISFTSGAFDYYRNSKLSKIVRVYSGFYGNFSHEVFRTYCQRFGLDTKKAVKELSAGMKVKFALALALSHEAKLFMFDEPTSGLDPIARDELLDVFEDLIKDGDKSILFSTHITGDLDKCADHILFISKGKVLLSCEKDKLLDEHAIVKGGLDQLTDELKTRLVSYKMHRFGFSALIERNKILPTDNFATEKPNLDDIMVYYNKENENA